MSDSLFNQMPITPDRLKALGFTLNRANQLSKELWDCSVHLEYITQDSAGNCYFSITQQNELSEESTIYLKSIKHMKEVKALYFLLTGGKTL